MVARLHLREPGLDVLARRAAGVAGRQEVDVDGPLGAHGAGAEAGQAERGERGEVALWSGHRRLLGDPRPDAEESAAYLEYYET